MLAFFNQDTLQPSKSAPMIDINQTSLAVSGVVEAAELLRRTFRFPVVYTAAAPPSGPLVRVLCDSRSRRLPSQFTFGQLRDTIGLYLAEHAEPMQTALVGASVLQLAMPTRQRAGLPGLQPREVNTFKAIETVVDAGLCALGLYPSEYFIDLTHVMPDENMRAALFFFALERFIKRIKALAELILVAPDHSNEEAPIADSFDLSTVSSAEDLRDDMSDAETVDLNREMSVEV